MIKYVHNSDMAFLIQTIKLYQYGREKCDWYITYKMLSLSMIQGLEKRYSIHFLFISGQYFYFSVNLVWEIKFSTLRIFWNCAVLTT